MNSLTSALCRRFVLLLMLTGSSSYGSAANERSDLMQQERFRGVGLVLVTDAIAGEVMRGVSMDDDQGRQIFSKARVASTARGIGSYPSARIPLSIHTVWRTDPKAVSSWRGIEFEGAIAGDYTVPVAARIPDEVLDNIRQHGGSLRLKFRLKADGVMFGWDIERKSSQGDVSVFESPGGDFIQTRY